MIRPARVGRDRRESQRTIRPDLDSDRRKPPGDGKGRIGIRLPSLPVGAHGKKPAGAVVKAWGQHRPATAVSPTATNARLGQACTRPWARCGDPALIGWRRPARFPSCRCVDFPGGDARPHCPGCGKAQGMAQSWPAPERRRSPVRRAGRSRAPLPSRFRFRRDASSARPFPRRAARACAGLRRRLRAVSPRRRSGMGVRTVSRHRRSEPSGRRAQSLRALRHRFRRASWPAGQVSFQTPGETRRSPALHIAEGIDHGWSQRPVPDRAASEMDDRVLVRDCRQRVDQRF